MSEGLPRVLYIDDEQGNLTAFRFQFEQWYDVHTAPGGEEALRILEEQNIQIVIADQRMPGMTGTELLEKVAGAYPETVRMILTGYSDIEAVIDALNKGRAYHFFRKPWDEAVLRRTIDNALKEIELESRLRANESQLVRAQEVAQLGSWQLDVSKDILEWSDETYKIFGKSPGSPLTYEEFLSHIHPDDREAVDRAWQAALEGAAYEAEHRIVVDGQVKWVRERARIETDDSGELLRGVGTVQDITARRQAERRISETAERLELATSAAGLGVWDWYIPENQLVWDKSMYALFDVDETDFSGNYEGWEARVHPEDIERAAEEIQAALRGEKNFNTSFRIVRRDGTVRHISGMGVVHHDSDGQALRMVGINADITERIEAEEQIGTLSEVVQQSPTHIVVTDPNGTIEYVNPAFCAVTGYAEAELLGNNPHLLASGETPRSTYEDLWETVRAGRVWRGEFKNRRKDGTLFWESATISPVVDANGVITHLVGNKQDISTRKLIEQELRETQMQYTDFVNHSTDIISYWRMPPGLKTSLPVEEQVAMIYEAVCLDCNRALWELYDFPSKDDIVGKRLDEIAKAGSMDSQLTAFVTGGYQVCDAEVTQAVPGNDHIHTLGSWWGVVEDGELTRLWARSLDVSPLRHAQEQVSHERDFAERVINSLPGMFYLFDRDGRMVRWNRNMERVTGYSSEEIADMSPMEFIGEDTRESTQNSIEEVFSTGKSSTESLVLTKDGETVPFLLTGFRVDIDGEPHVIGTGFDIADRVAAENELKKHRDHLEDLVQERAAELKESEQRFRSLVGNIPGAVYRCEMDDFWTMHYMSEYVETITGYPASDFLENRQRAYASVIHPDDTAHVKAEVKRGVERDGYFACEYRIRHADGSTRWVFERGALVQQDATGSRHLDGFIMDVTERRLAEELVRLSEEKFRGLVETTSEWIWEVDAKGRYTYVSPRVKDLIGYEPEEVLGKSPFDLMPPDEAARVGAEFLGFIEARASFNGLENRNLHKDGRILVLETSGVPILGPDDEFLGYRGVDRDVTERRDAEEKIRESEERFRAIFEDAPVGVAHLDLEGHPMNINAALHNMLGYAKGEEGELTFKDVTHPDDMEASAQAMRELTTGQRDSVHQEKRYVSKDGSLIWASTGISLMRDAKGKPHSLIAIIEDITERRNAREALVEAKHAAETASKAKSAFLASMSHELRTPLNSILGFSQMLREKYFGDLTEKQEEYVGDIMSSGEHLLSLINDVLDLSKVEAGKMTLELTNVRLGDLIESSTVMIKEKAMRHQIAVEVHIHGDLHDQALQADERKLKQIMFNLLSNAAKFTPDGGGITIEAGPAGDGMILVSVADTGVGISPDDHARIFDTFEQAKAGTTGKTPGTGLGLSISRKFVAMHGGRLWVESDGEGKGSRFSFTLSLDPADLQEDPE